MQFWFLWHDHYGTFFQADMFDDMEKKMICHKQKKFAPPKKDSDASMDCTDRWKYYPNQTIFNP